jgi:hypothetical protein
MIISEEHTVAILEVPLPYTCQPWTKMNLRDCINWKFVVSMVSLHHYYVAVLDTVIAITPWLSVHERTKPTERPSLVGEVSANCLLTEGASRGQRGGSSTVAISDF